MERRFRQSPMATLEWNEETKGQQPTAINLDFGTSERTGAIGTGLHFG